VLVIDTNILVYLLMQGDHTEKAQALFVGDADWRSEGFVLIEFSNVLMTYLRTGALNRQQAQRLLAEAERRMRRLINVPHARALDVAGRLGLSAYDARFITAAQSLGTKLVTEDTKLRAAAPALTASLREALAER
jgi:predicted nucleic acid-binding protein